MVLEGNKRGLEVQNDRQVDEIATLPYRIGYPIGARGRGGGGLREGMRDFVFGEGDRGGDFPQPASAW